MKYTNLKECTDCSLAQEGICQKVFKMKITKDLFKKRMGVERVNNYLKEFFQLNNKKYHSEKRGKIHFDLITLVYNTSKLASDRLNVLVDHQQTA